MTLTIASTRVLDASTVSEWSPGPGYVELLVAQAWARPAREEGFEVVVLTHLSGQPGRPALASGVVPVSILQLADLWLVGLPDELHTLIDGGWLDLHEVGLEHPVLAYCDARIDDLGSGIEPQSWVDLGLDPAEGFAVPRPARGTERAVTAAC